MDFGGPALQFEDMFFHRYFRWLLNRGGCWSQKMNEVCKFTGNTVRSMKVYWIYYSVEPLFPVNLQLNDIQAFYKLI